MSHNICTHNRFLYAFPLENRRDARRRKKERKKREGPLKIAGDVVIDELLHHPHGTFAAVMFLFATRATTTTGNHYHLIPTCRVFIIQSECNWSHTASCHHHTDDDSIPMRKYSTT